MPRFKVPGIRRQAQSGGGGSSPLAITYDNRFGTDTTTAASNGWFTFDLRSGCRRIWVNSSGGNDANTGLSAAQAKATLDAARTLWLGGGYTAGDQLMIAGTGGRTYTDGGGTRWRDVTGFSAAYPIAALSYDPADAANSAKYGKLTGADMPVITIPASGGAVPLFDIAGNTFTNHYAMQGLHIKTPSSSESNILGVIGVHTNFVFQNCRFENTSINFQAQSTDKPSDVNISKSAFWGAWAATGRGGGILFGDTDNVITQDVIFAHGGWKMGASRDDAASAGGATDQSHSFYYHASCNNGRFDRIVGFDASADTFNFRGECSATQIVSWDEPIAGFTGGYSGSYLERPLGSLVTVDDWVIMGGANINTSNPRGIGPDGVNFRLGTYIKNVAMFDNPRYGLTNNYNFDWHNDTAASVDNYITAERIRGYNYSPTLRNTASSQDAKIHPTYIDCILDVAGATGVTVHSGLTTYPNAKTRDEVITAVLTAVSVTPGADYNARKAQLVNLMLWRPDLDWARYIHAVALPAYGLTSSYAAATPPNLSAESPAAVY